MATMVATPHAIPKSRSPSPQAIGLALDASRFRATPIPNRHIPYCSPGPAPSTKQLGPVTPPASPQKNDNTAHIPASILHPVPSSCKTVHGAPQVYSIDPETLVDALNHIATTPLPLPKHVFPWLHGLHEDNEMQVGYFTNNNKKALTTPKGLRSITLVKCGGDLSKARLKGAIAPCEVLAPTGKSDPVFFDVDPKEGFSCRNFHIQIVKMAMVSDIVVYGDDATMKKDVKELGISIASAQQRHREKMIAKTGDDHVAKFNTFVLSGRFEELENSFPKIISIDSNGASTGNVVDMFALEREEMHAMAAASEISPNVFLGPTPASIKSEHDYDILVEASDMVRCPSAKTLRNIAEKSYTSPQTTEFPSSGSILPPTWSHTEVDSLLRFLKWMYTHAQSSLTPSSSSSSSSSFDDSRSAPDSEGDIPMKPLPPLPRKFLLHCSDGYTETSLLGLAYYMYAEYVPAHTAWIALHVTKKRNFFAYQSDVALLNTIQARIMYESPRNSCTSIPNSVPDDPAWIRQIDGSIPSRIMDYMYLGNLGHANNPELLRLLGIGRVLSVGERLGWTQEVRQRWTGNHARGEENLMFVDGCQDNGVDELAGEVDRCLDFIGMTLLPSPPSCSSVLGVLVLMSFLHCSPRPRTRHRHPRPLPRGCLPLCYDLYCRGHAYKESQLPSRLVRTLPCL
jgi:dual specificity MAP kinase phosphatase